MTGAALQGDDTEDPGATAHVQHAQPGEVVLQQPAPNQRSGLVVACAEGHLGLDDDLQRDLRTGCVEGGTYEASLLAQYDGLEVVLLPLLIPVDVGHLLAAVAELHALEDGRREQLRERLVALDELGGDIGQQVLAALAVEAVEAYGGELRG